MATYNVLDLAAELYDETNSEDSVAAISFYLRNNIGKLNNLIGTSISINTDTLNFDSALSEGQKVIFKKLYLIYYYDKLILNNTGATSFTSTIEVTSDGASIKKIGKDNLIRSLLSIKQQHQNELNELIKSYKIGETTVKAVHGSDYIAPGESSDFPKTTYYYRRER